MKAQTSDKEHSRSQRVVERQIQLAEDAITVLTTSLVNVKENVSFVEREMIATKNTLERKVDEGMAVLAINERQVE